MNLDAHDLIGRRGNPLSIPDDYPYSKPICINTV